MNRLKEREAKNWRYRHVGIPQQFRTMTWEQVVVHDGIDSAYNEARELDARLEADDNHGGVGLTLVGPAGCGKTMLAALLARSQFLRHHQPKLAPEQEQDEALQVRFLTAHGYQRLLLEWGEGLRSTNTGADDVGTENYQGLAHTKRLIDIAQREARLLVLDDLGREDHSFSFFIENQLRQLIRDRYDLGLTTVITTNVRPTDFDKVYFEGLHSFLYESSTIVGIEDNSAGRQA